MTVDHLDPTPEYLQLANILRQKIHSREITGVLPSNKTLQQTYEVGEYVVSRAVRVLADEGLVVAIPRRGVYVKP